MTGDPRRRLVNAIFVITVGCAAALRPAQSAGDPQRAVTGWTLKFDESGSNPVIVDGVLYVGSADGAVYALDPRTGQTKWRFQTGESLSPSSSGPQIITVPHGTSMADQIDAAMNAAEKQRGAGIRRVDMTPAIQNGTVFIGSGDQSFYGIDASTGKKKWSNVVGPGMAANNFSNVTAPAAVVKNGTVYFVSEAGLHALHALDGKRKWLFETLQEMPIEQMNMREKRVPAGPVMGDGVIFVTAWPYALGSAPPKSFVYAVDPESGKAKWVNTVDGLDISAPTTAKGLVFFAVEERPTILARADRVTLYAVHAADGQIKWKFGAEKQWGTRPLLVTERTIYFCTEKSLFALELETGRQLWSLSGDEIKRDLQSDDRHLYLVTHKGSMARPKDTLHALALASGQEKWSRAMNARIAMVHDGVVYGDGEELHAFDAATGKELWSSKQTGRMSEGLISEGRVFLTSPTVGYIGMKKVDQGQLYAIDAKTGKLKP